MQNFVWLLYFLTYMSEFSLKTRFTLTLPQFKKPRLGNYDTRIIPRALPEVFRSTTGEFKI